MGHAGLGRVSAGGGAGAKYFSLFSQLANQKWDMNCTDWGAGAKYFSLFSQLANQKWDMNCTDCRPGLNIFLYFLNLPTKSGT